MATSARVQLIETGPAAQVIAQANAAFVVTDARGREITLKKAGVLAQFRLIEALGDTAKNEVYVRMAMPLLFVADIDGDPVLPMTRKAEVEALIQRLDDEGIAAVHEGVQAHFGQRNTPEEDKAALLGK